METALLNQLEQEEKEAVQKLRATYAYMRTELAKRIVGQQNVLDQLIISLFAGGHCLLLGVPGLAKTLMIRSLAELLSLSFSRIQFTPDLMPSDITGAEVLTEEKDKKTREFTFIPGPIFANVVLADEINRTPPKTQASLMEAMEELTVTVGGKQHNLDFPFFVLATQNPIEQEGTYPLPAAQLDRFMFMVYVDYPSEREEYEILRLTTTRYRAELKQLLTKEDIVNLIKIVRKVRVSDDVMRYATQFARLTRPKFHDAPEFVREWIAWGAGPRAAQSMIIGAKARAMLHGRYDVAHKDIRALAHPVMRHRIIPNFHAEAEGITTDKVIDMLVEHIPAPDYEPEKKKKKSFWARLFGKAH
ncbi:MAG: MoxR family ATPase [Planctomycetota bacterium]